MLQLRQVQVHFFNIVVTSVKNFQLLESLKAVDVIQHVAVDLYFFHGKVPKLLPHEVKVLKVQGLKGDFSISFEHLSFDDGLCSLYPLANSHLAETMDKVIHELLVFGV